MREGERREMREERGRNPKSLEVYVRQKTKPAPLFVEKHAPLEFGHRTTRAATTLVLNNDRPMVQF